MTKEEKFQKLDILFGTLDWLDTKYKLCISENKRISNRSQFNQTKNKICDIYATLTIEELQEYNNR